MNTTMNLGNRCKWYEKNFSLELAIPTLPVIIRLDGVNFSKWTKGLKKPFDEGLNTLMTETTKFLVKKTNAIVGYTQSDEITLILYSDSWKSQIYHNGKKSKILSKLTSECSNFFNEKRHLYLPKHNKIANFDCRVYQTPSLIEATNQLLWREIDATKNSVSSLAQFHFSHDDLQNLNQNQMQDKLMLEKNINWNDLPSKFKRGVYIKRQIKSMKLTELDLINLQKENPKHNALKNPKEFFNRSVIERIEYPIFTKITNPVDVIFYDKEVKYNKDED